MPLPQKTALEVNIDTLVGPTHHFGGHSYGNIASLTNKLTPSNPQKAALQGLKKMKLVYDIGVPQIIFPPAIRPDYTMLRRIGFSGTEEEIIHTAYQSAPWLLLQCCSSSSMWTANCATVCPSVDSIDGRCHLTPANLLTHFHRSCESSFAHEMLHIAFPHSSLFHIHPPLPHSIAFADEGAANHIRFCSQFDHPGLHLFVYGHASAEADSIIRKYPARQTLLASQALARLHQIPIKQMVFAQQNTHSIDCGAFHNDVMSTGHMDLFIVHEKSFSNTEKVVDELMYKFHSLGGQLHVVFIPENDLSVEETVTSYLFNSQILTDPHSQEKRMILIAPLECTTITKAQKCIDQMLEDSSNPIQEVQYVHLNESMKNGGGPACLRLRLVMQNYELQTVPNSLRFSPSLYENLHHIIESTYPTAFSLDQLLDKDFRYALFQAYQAVYTVLGINHLIK